MVRTRTLCLLIPFLIPSSTAAAPQARGKWLDNHSGKTVIRKLAPGNDITIAVVSRSGSAVVLDPQYMPEGVVPDFIAVTHRAHLSKPYLEANATVPVAVQQTGSWTAGDIRIAGLPTPNRSGDYAGIVTYLLEVDGLRIAFFSCDNQGPLEPSQRLALGKVDVAIITADNDPPGGRTNISVEHTRALMKEVGARIVVPLSHHVSDVEYAFGDFSDDRMESVNGQLVLDPATVDQGERQRFIHIAPTGVY